MKQFSFFLCAGQVAQTAGVSARLLQAHAQTRTSKSFRVSPRSDSCHLLGANKRPASVEKCKRTHLAAIKWSWIRRGCAIFLFPGSVLTVYWHGATRTARLRHVNQNATHMWVKARLLYRNARCAHSECQNKSLPPLLHRVFFHFS